jgi:hypothetical protein
MSVWTQKRIGAVDTETGLRAVRLPTVPGMKASVRDAVFAFERENLGTVRAIIRMNKRAEGTEVPTPAKLAGKIPAALASVYAEVDA